MKTARKGFIHGALTTALVISLALLPAAALAVAAPSRISPATASAIASSMPSEVAAPGAESAAADELAYARLWHASPVVGSGFSERLALMGDHGFLWAASEMDGLSRTRFRAGTWALEGGKLRLSTAEEVRWEGGREEAGLEPWGTDAAIVDATVALVKTAEPSVEVFELGPVTTDPEVMDKRTVTIGGIAHWELAHPMDLEQLYADYASAKGQADAPVDEGAQDPGGGDRPTANEAYADILDEYHDFMFYRESAQMDLDEGKVALRDVYGDATPELLFVYRKFEGSENLMVYTHSQQEGASVLFDDMICSFAADCGNYCLFIAEDGSLMAYCSTRDPNYAWGFWDIGQMLGAGRDGNQSLLFQCDADAALLHYASQPMGAGQSAVCRRSGDPISEAELGARAKALVGGIQTVIFQSDILLFDNFDGTFRKAGLYDVEPIWRDVTPFSADFMIWEVARNKLRGYEVAVQQDVSTHVENGKTHTFYAGVLLADRFFHDGRGEWIPYYYVEIGEEQYKRLTGEASAPPRPIEIQVYSSSAKLDLDRYLGKYIEFSGEHFEAQTVYHRRAIVFEIDQMFGQ